MFTTLDSPFQRNYGTSNRILSEEDDKPSWVPKGLVVLAGVVLLALAGTVAFKSPANDDDFIRGSQTHVALEGVRADATPVIEQQGPFNRAPGTLEGPQTNMFMSGDYVTSIKISGGTTWLTGIELGYGYDAAKKAPTIGRSMTEFFGTYSCKSPSYFNRIQFRMMKCSGGYCHDQLIKFKPFCNKASDEKLEPAGSNAPNMGYAYASDSTSTLYDVTFPGPLVGISANITRGLWAGYGGIVGIKFYYQAGPPGSSDKLSYLYLTATQGDYAAAKDACKISGGVMASLHSAEENARAQALCQGKKCYFGYNDIATEGTWVWEDGSSTTYTNWAPNEPNNSNGNEDCAEIYQDGKWNDITCGKTDYYGICGKISKVTSYDCPPGTQEVKRNSAGCVCTLCPVGNLCLGGKKAPEQCGTGTFQPIRGQSECDPTPPGTKVNTTGAVAPVKCDPGTYQDLFGQATCKQAPKGSKVSGPGATSAVQCPPGEFQANLGQAACDPCPAGHYCPENGLPGAIKCNFGTFQPSTGKASCTQAPAGSIVDAEGKDAPTQCPANTFQAHPGQMACIPCPYKTVAAGTGNTACTPAP